jgi:MSHA biogenesis protein MshK
MVINKIYLITMILISFSLSVMANTELPDPTRPATYVNNNEVYIEAFDDNSRETISWRLSAIRLSKNDKTAILNGKLVREGDHIGDAEIIEIKPLSVVINYENKNLIVRLFNNLVVKDYKSKK